VRREEGLINNLRFCIIQFKK